MPGIVSGREEYRSVVLVAITSQPSDSHVVSLDEHDDVDGKLPRTSFVKVSKLFTTHPTLVLKKVCAIKPARLNVVLKELRRFFQEQPPRPLWRSPRHVWHETHTVTSCCRRRSVLASLASRPLAAFPVSTAGRLPHCVFRGLLGVHSRCGLCGR